MWGHFFVLVASSFCFQPENILCGDRIVDIKLADFGLSHLVNPHERMMMACGTLSYVGELVFFVVRHASLV